MHNYAPITNRKIRLALVGCGRVANNHVAAIESQAGKAELVDVFDINATALEHAVSRAKVTVHRNLADMPKKTIKSNLPAEGGTFNSAGPASYCTVIAGH
jgi:UDP-N-acetyl-2-amino-2-deoxyglucuronate dehydrogenase